MTEPVAPLKRLTRRQRALINKMLSEQRRLLKVRAKQRRKRERQQREQDKRDRKDHIIAHRARRAAEFAWARYENRRLGLKRRPSQGRIIMKDGKTVDHDL